MGHQGPGHHIAAAMQHMQQQHRNHQEPISHYQQQPQVGMVHPLNHGSNSTNSSGFIGVPPSPTPPPPPPPPPPIQEMPAGSPISDSLPEPPIHLQQNPILEHFDRPGNGILNFKLYQI